MDDLFVWVVSLVFDVCGNTLFFEQGWQPIEIGNINAHFIEDVEKWIKWMQESMDCKGVQIRNYDNFSTII